MDSVFRDRTQLVLVALLSRLVVIFVQIVGRSLLSDYDTSAEKCLERNPESYEVCNGLTFVLCGNLKWDGEYFVSIAEEGYQYEQTMAFFPLLPVLSRVLDESILLPFQWLCKFHLRLSILFSVLLLNLCLFVLSVVALYEVVSLVCQTKRVALMSSLLFCFNPASVFMSVMYSEVLFSFCTFFGLWLLLTGRHWLSSLLFALSSAARSNGIVNCGFIAYSCLTQLQKQQRPGDMIFHLLVSVTQCLISSLPFIAFQVYGYFQFCTGVSDRSWCYDYIPLIYSFIQKHYWNVGLFQYYELKQLPNFLLASPSVVMSSIYVVFYFKSLLNKQFNSNFHTGKKYDNNGGIWSVTALPFVVHLAFLLLLGSTSMHVQVITRMICSSTPAFYWFAAYAIDLDAKQFNLSRICRGFIGLYFVTYYLVGTLLHSMFYPWT